MYDVILYKKIRQCNYESLTINFRYIRGLRNDSIWLDNLACTENDVVIESCRQNEFGMNECDHSNDVALSCYQSKSTDCSKFHKVSNY